MLTFRLGLGMDFEAPWPQPLLEAMSELGIGSGPPQPQVSPRPDEWMRRLATLPLLYQPGERWLYNTGSDVLGVLDRPRRRPAARRVPARARVRTARDGPTPGSPPHHVDRLGTCYTTNPETGEPIVYDPPAGQWATPPAFPSGGGGLVSTIDDYHAFARMLLAERPAARRFAVAVAGVGRAMTTDQHRRRPGGGGPSPDGSQGWGFGVGVTGPPHRLATTPGAYGWAGGLGSSWANDPSERLLGVVLTTDMFTSAFPTAEAIQDFWTCVYAAIDD